MRTEQEWCKLINDYENIKPAICGTTTLIAFLRWCEENDKFPNKQRDVN